jgi:predicted ATPase/DNA-binding CsgD family transcriptional regulator
VRPGESFESSIARFLTGGPALLVLDNCEHVLDAAAALIHSLMETCPELRVLATSRERIGLEGEATLAVPPLEVPGVDAGVKSPEEALSFAAIELFTARASASNSAFSLTEANLQRVIEICRRLEGIPLGIELAAVRMRTLSIDDLHKRLDDQLSLLNLNSRSAEARHQTLTATLDWSHDLLCDREQLLWYRLSVFSGGFTIDAVEHVCSDDALPKDSIFDTLTDLLEKSLVVVDWEASNVRYRLLEPVRLYGLERLRKVGEELDVRRRHLGWCLEWTAEIGRWQTGLTERDLRRVVEERGNSLGALDFSVSDVGDPSQGLELIEHLARAWLICEWFREISHYGGSLLATNIGLPRVRARVFYAVGVAALLNGDGIRAQAHFENCRLISLRRRGYELERGLARTGLSSMAFVQGEWARASAYLSDAIDLFDRAGATVMKAQAMCYLAGTEAHGENVSVGARSLIETSLELNKQVGDAYNPALARYILGELELRDARPAEAESNFLWSLRVKDRIGHRSGVTYNLLGLAFTAAADHRNTRAAQLLGAVDALAVELGQPIPDRHAADRRDWEMRARRALGDGTFDRLYAVGRELRLTHAVQLALGDPAVRQEHSSNGEKPSLTRRESEVARLIATGATNRKIAAALVISDQTVKFHVHNILAKLSFESRSEIAAWQARKRMS